MEVEGSFLDILKKFRENKKYCDAILKIKGSTEEIPAHQVVLSAWSSYFDERFSALSSHDNLKCRVIFSNFQDINTLDKLIGFLYSRKISIDESNISLLANTALCLKIDPLLSVCWQYIKDRLSNNFEYFIPSFFLSQKLNIEKWIWELCIILHHNVAKIVQHEKFKLLPFSAILHVVKIYMTHLENHAHMTESTAEQTKELDCIFSMIFAWVNHDLPNRQKLLPLLYEKAALFKFDCDVIAKTNLLQLPAMFLYVLLQIIYNQGCDLGSFMEIFPSLRSMFSEIYDSSVRESEINCEFISDSLPSISFTVEHMKSEREYSDASVNMETSNIYSSHLVKIDEDDKQIKTEISATAGKGEYLKEVSNEKLQICSEIKRRRKNSGRMRVKISARESLKRNQTKYLKCSPDEQLEEQLTRVKYEQARNRCQSPETTEDVETVEADVDCDTKLQGDQRDSDGLKSSGSNTSDTNPPEDSSPKPGRGSPRVAASGKYNKHLTNERYTKPANESNLSKPVSRKDRSKAAKYSSSNKPDNEKNCRKLDEESSSKKQANKIDHNRPVCGYDEEDAYIPNQKDQPNKSANENSCNNSVIESIPCDQIKNDSDQVAEVNNFAKERRKREVYKPRRHYMKDVDKIFRCDFCEFTTKINHEFYQHCKIHFEGPPYKCRDCNYMNPSVRCVILHRYKHSEKRSFTCEECGHMFKFPTGLLSHMKTHEIRERNFPCKICQKTFYTASQLEAHVDTHQKERPFLCDMCGFTSKRRSDLMTHKRIHTGRVFRCDFPDCNYFSPRKTTFRRHSLKHGDVREHQCPTCGKVFRNKKSLQIHENIHTGNKPFKCGECWYATYRKDKLKEHLVKRHGDNPTAKRKMPVPRKKALQECDSFTPFSSRQDFSLPSNSDQERFEIQSASNEIESILKFT